MGFAVNLKGINFYGNQVSRVSRKLLEHYQFAKFAKFNFCKNLKFLNRVIQVSV